MGLRNDISTVIENATEVLGQEAEDMPGNKAIPQVQQALEYISENPVEVARIFRKYRELVLDMITLSENDLRTIEKANQVYAGSKTNADSASKMTTRELLEIMKLKKNELQIDFILPKPSDFQKALVPLFNMMSLASTTIRENPNFKPKDGDELFDKMIWGHTQIQSQNPIVLVHFIIAHGIERYIIKELNLDIPKDSVLNALTDTLCFQYQKDKSNKYKSIVDIWQNPKEPFLGQEGGLGWLKLNRLLAFSIIKES